MTYSLISIALCLFWTTDPSMAEMTVSQVIGDVDLVVTQLLITSESLTVSLSCLWRKPSKTFSWTSRAMPISFHLLLILAKRLQSRDKSGVVFKTSGTQVTVKIVKKTIKLSFHYLNRNKQIHYFIKKYKFYLLILFIYTIYL